MRNSHSLVPLTESELHMRRSLKWSRAGPGLVPVNVAEADFAVAGPIREALVTAVTRSDLGYPDFDSARGGPQVVPVAGEDSEEISTPEALMPAERVAVIVLCNPHNPTGRLFGVGQRTIVFTSAAKSFNIPGLRCAVGHFGSSALLHRFRELPWHLRSGTAARSDPIGHLRKEQKMLLQDGTVFGQGYSGFARLNFATPESRLGDVLSRLVQILPPIGFGYRLLLIRALTGGTQR